MNELQKVLDSYSLHSIGILDSTIPMNKYILLNLSKSNEALLDVDITNPVTCQSYIDTVVKSKDGIVAYGGYLEERNLYADKDGFSAAHKPKRNIHLGIDFWTNAGTKVLAPIDGKVHSFKNNNVVGDYGPTIILEHTLHHITFYTLYGHLSIESLTGLFKGKVFRAGETLAKLGTPDINVNYAPHLHFQIIKDLEGNEGDYPGVCAVENLQHYKFNCPNPNYLLKIKGSS
ncbi:peptidoglycan DD-metalloendopeptidase family protein [Maribacter dokdonensis]|uniref:peptidoglycan DD-metalloendopeptidase family protein n=1 Tax=Maribacter dokdonensis TaxID=320912 RepID=UPI0027376890|nr:peptidoglycan DD-metalloendopeptidase family protein [Maribacter dokdonensis]MDP2526939.1 peptidoglycan DD-metalloendopeptidase family protein [Maribacter dokdonensis]